MRNAGAREQAIGHAPAIEELPIAHWPFVRQSNYRNSNRTTLPVEYTACCTRVFNFIHTISHAASHCACYSCLFDADDQALARQPAAALCLEQVLRASAGSKSSPAHPFNPSIHPARAILATPPLSLRLIIPSPTHPSTTTTTTPSPHRYASTPSEPCDFACQAVAYQPQLC
jgi:hypothetical protein